MADCNSLESLMTSLTNEVATLKTKVATLEGKQNNYATKSELSNAIAEVRRFAEAAINALRDIINGLLGGNNSGLEQRLKNLEIRVGGLDAITDSINRTIQALQGRFGRLEGIVGQLSSRVSALENSLGQVLMDIKNIYKIVTGHGVRISGLENSIGQVLMDIRNIYNIVTGYGKRISASENSIGQILMDIKNIYNILKNLKLQKGEKGEKGNKGEKGDKGDKGQKGDKGDDSNKGDYATKRELGEVESRLKGLIDGLRNTLDFLNGVLEGIRNTIADILKRLFGFGNLEQRVTNLEIGLRATDKLLQSVNNAVLNLQKAVKTLEKGYESISNVLGQVLQDIKNIYDQLKRLKKVEFTSIPVTIFDGYDNNGNAKFKSETVQVIKGTETDRTKEYEQVAKLRAAQNGTQTQLTGDVVINDDWNIANGFSFSNPNNDPSIQLANTQANNVLSAAVSVGKTYANQGVELQAGGALVPVGKSVIALIPVIVALFKGLKLPTAILLDTIGSLIREILLEQIRDKLRGDNAVAAIPEWWAVRVGADRPQLVILYGESLSNNGTGRSRYPLTIPYYKFTGKGSPVFPTYQKGSWEGTLTLKDNSKVTINAISYNEASRVLGEIKKFIDPAKLDGVTQKIGERGGVALKKITVKPCTAKYFATGQKDMNPTYTLNL